MKLSVVVLTMGNRPEELARAVRSALEQEHVDVEVVLVGNGVDPVGDRADAAPFDDERVKTLTLPTNLGIPGGRNRGVEASCGDVILFLDDDGWYRSTRLGVHLRDRFSAEPDLGVVSFRVRDPEGGRGERRHVPRLRAGDPERSSPVTTFLGGACAVRRAAFDAGGGLPEDFFYAHEETDLAWRLLGLGYRLEYDAEAVMCHPALPNARHAAFYRLDGRNRVLLARRNLPWPLAAAYLLNWFTLTVVRERSATAVRAWAAGFRQGWRMDPGWRRPMSARTAWRMTRAGRPPVI